MPDGARTAVGPSARCGNRSNTELAQSTGRTLESADIISRCGRRAGAFRSGFVRAPASARAITCRRLPARAASLSLSEEDVQMGNANRAKLAGCWMFLAAIALPGT